MSSVYFTGSSGSGKTTTAFELEQYVNLETVDGLSRNSPFKMGTDEGQQYLSKKVYAECINFEERIHCRTPIDVYAYTQAYGRYSPRDEMYIEVFRRFEPKIVYFPMFDHIEDDGFRPTDRALNEKVDSIIRRTIEEYNFNCLKLTTDSTPLERVRQIIQFYRSYDEREFGKT